MHISCFFRTPSSRSKRSKLSTANISPKTRTLPKAFTEKGLYMLATILKSPVATQTTLAIVETFAKMRELSRAVGELADSNDEYRQKSLMQQSGEILSDLLDDGMRTTDTETTIELNFAVLKLKHTVKRKKAATMNDLFQRVYQALRRGRSHLKTMPR